MYIYADSYKYKELYIYVLIYYKLEARSSWAALACFGFPALSRRQVLPLDGELALTKATKTLFLIYILFLMYIYIVSYIYIHILFLCFNVWRL